MIDLAAKVTRAAAEGARVKEAFFAANAERIVACARELERAFAAGGRLFTLGNGGGACEAQHAAVEFSHPIFEKRAAIPAFSLAADVAHVTALGNDRDFSQAFAGQLRVLGRRGDVVLALSTSGTSPSVLRALAAARELGILTVGLTGRDGGKMVTLSDHAFVVESFSVHRIQEVHLALVHVLWDLVHVIGGAEDVLT